MQETVSRAGVLIEGLVVSDPFGVHRHGAAVRHNFFEGRLSLRAATDMALNGARQALANAKAAGIINDGDEPGRDTVSGWPPQSGFQKGGGR